ncbi:hypothetical protein P5673_023662 [Acropora cervicornis]|uniref:Uncharacterized protein n=1 Tax=Acropora cervicornis TaxID=6130 RepID=A0AAD9Q5G8_ACRCE|nr:hypothetical protein P5673_023662 [Acropora cervicornis]
MPPKMFEGVMLHVLATASTQTLKPETLHGDCPWSWTIMNDSKPRKRKSKHTYTHPQSVQ